MNLYRDESSTPKYDAQRNLCGRTHYVDDDTLRFHKSRILSTHVTDNGLLFALVESCALDMNNMRRGYRHVIFDVFGNTIDRQDIDSCHKTSKAAKSAMWAALNSIDAKAVTLAAIDRDAKQHAQECEFLRVKVLAIGQKVEA